MKQSIRFWYACGIALCSYAAIRPTQALPVPDATLPNNSIVTNQGNISTITGGTRAGGNLFHSFSEFSVPTKGTAFFNNAVDIQNIISRVTGASRSTIDGLIQANGKANLFLINPNGILFDRNASLKIGGSFVASTASSLKFADGTQFSATAPQTTPLLTISVPIGLQFGANPGAIRVLGDGQGIRQTSDLNDTNAGLHVASNQTLALVGGDMALTGGTLKTAGGRIELGSVAGSSLVSLTPIDKGLALGYEGVQKFGNIKLSQQAAVDASGLGGGDIQVQGNQVTLTDGSEIEASTLGTEPGGNLVVNAQDSVQVIGNSADDQFSSALSAAAYPTATGAAGNLTIKTGKLIISDGAQVGAGTFGQGQGGKLSVTASDLVEVSGTTPDGQFPTGLFTQTRGAGAAGELTIKTGKLIISDGAQLGASTFGQGQGGKLSVTASNSVELSGNSPNGQSPSGLFADTQGAGAAGELTIKTGKLIVSDGAQVATGTLGQGQGGKLSVTASDLVELSGTSPDGQFSGGLFTETHGAGAAGDLTIATGNLLVQNGARVSARTFGQGNGGSIQVNATSVNLSGVSPSGLSSGLLTSTYGVGQAGNINVNSSTFRIADGAVVDATTTGKGDITNNSNAFRGGTININANTFDVTNGGKLRTTTSGTGLAGDINLKVVNNVTLLGQGSGIFANTTADSTGSGGSIVIDPNQLKLADGARVAVDSRGTGQGGNLNVQANYLTLDNKAFLSATTNSSTGGNITLNVPSLLLMRHNSGISASAGVASGSGNGGNITINTPFIVSAPLENSDITANASSGKGGNVNILARGIFWLEPRSKEELQTLLNTQVPAQLDPSKLPTNDITAISQQGSPLLSGQVTINTSGIDPSRGLIPLPAVVVDKSGLIAQGCAAGNGTTGSQFVVTGRGGLPPNPSEPLSSDAVWSDTRLPATTVKKHHSQTVTARQPSKPAAVPMVPATGWVFNGKGEVTLTATAPNDTIQIPWITPATCHAQ